jgi:Family of unknown function (DUF6236)
MSNIIQFKKKKVNRGIVAPNGIMAINGNSLVLQRSYIPEDIFYYVMYWDKIAIPTSPVIHFGLPFENELNSLGILERPTLPAIGSVDVAKHVHWTFGEIAKQKLNNEDEDWIVHHMSGDPIYLPEHATKKDTIRLKITNALPIPSVNGNFSLNDLLEFKMRRSSELEGLHSTMDRFLKKLNSEEIDVIRKTELKRFENAILELDKTVVERFKIIKKSDVELNIDLKSDALLALALNTPAIIHDIQTNNIPLATIATSILSVLSFQKKYGFTFNQYNHGDFNLEYISSARSENIVI